MVRKKIEKSIIGWTYGQTDDTLIPKFDSGQPEGTVLADLNDAGKWSNQPQLTMNHLTVNKNVKQVQIRRPDHTTT